MSSTIAFCIWMSPSLWRFAIRNLLRREAVALIVGQKWMQLTFNRVQKFCSGKTSTHALSTSRNTTGYLENGFGKYCKYTSVDMRFLRWVHGVTHRDKVRSCEIRNVLNVKPLLGIERYQLRWFGHLTRMPHKRLVRWVLLATPTGKWAWTLDFVILTRLWSCVLLLLSSV